MDKNGGVGASQQEQENSIMRKGFYKSIFINIFFLAGLAALYFFNRQYHFLDKLIGNIKL